MESSVDIGIDTGGTFVDLISYNSSTGEITVLKEPSSGQNPALALINVLKRYGKKTKKIVHGTTVATNAILERKGSEIAYLTTKGFKDVPYIQRIDRKYHYDLSWTKPKPLVKRRNCIEVTERINYKGEVLEDLRITELMNVINEVKKQKINSVAVCFLFSYINPKHEILAKEMIQKEYPEAYVSVSSEVYPKWKEYERSSTTIADAFLKPLIVDYARNIESGIVEFNFSKSFAFMKANGGTMTLESIIRCPVQTINSGPAAGIIGAIHFGELCGYKNLVTLDMGGTSCDISAIVDGYSKYVTTFEIEWGLPIQIPMIDVRSIGAGGGSIAWIDKGGLLRVGPLSAGANPGPACYSKGGKNATITDADLILGYLNPNNFAGGEIFLHKNLSERAIKELARKLNMDLYETASSIVRIANNNILNSVNEYMTRRGIDPRDFALFAYGGAGPIHASDIIKELNIRNLIVPLYPGAFSAFGLLMADARVDLERTLIMNSLNFNLNKIRHLFEDLKTSCLEELKSEGYNKVEEASTYSSIEMRYFGQNYELEVPVSIDDISEKGILKVFNKFHERHELHYGYRIEDEIIELISIKMTAILKLTKPKIKELEHSGIIEPSWEREAYFDGKFINSKIYDRAQLPKSMKIEGPAIIEEASSTTVIQPNEICEVDRFGNLIITLSKK